MSKLLCKGSWDGVAQSLVGNSQADGPSRSDGNSAAYGPMSSKIDSKLQSQINEAVKQKFSDNDPQDWPLLYKLKLKFCYSQANFQAESKKNPEQIEFRDKKKEVLIELIDVLDEGGAHD